ncbi:hypothetical protein [Burkholderia metallica]|uniref:hypothetical protein n=1 Tax=Burkholderia metallica TaxID=488729 RepID=UPI000D1B9B32|nr:hypothetical protein [Burkholderia metallica]MCA8022511.1 hypothetical protein [Burkholderia metallica]VWB43796.1 membrane protein [Burkholderia metallica]
MDSRSLVLCLASGLLATTTAIYGWKFLKKRNYLLGIEWLVVTVSSSNALIYFATQYETSGLISHFLDAFSRGFGMPIVAVAGLMAVTRGYKPSGWQDVALFGLSVAGTVVLVSGIFARELPYFYVVMWGWLTIYLAGFVRKLLAAGERFHAMTSAIAAVTSLAIACIYDFYPIPGDAHNVVLNFYVLALVTWSYLTVVLYYGYCALERAGQARDASRFRSTRNGGRRLA